MEEHFKCLQNSKDKHSKDISFTPGYIGTNNSNRTCFLAYRKLVFAKNGIFA